MFCRFVIGGLILGVAVSALANPTGMTVQSGSAAATVKGSQLTVTTSQNAFLNWQSFNIAAGETTVFNQPSAYSVVVNNIHDASASQIYGSLQANGLVVLMNQNGFYFGPNSFVKTGGLIVSTANCIPPQNTGGSWEFNGPPPLASIVNYGQIKVGQGGSAYLIADKVENYGDIEAPGGAAGLAAGQTVLLSERPDGRGMSMQVTLPQGSVDNEGKLVADAGTIAMNAQVVNQNGLVQADTVRNQNGIIELVASSQLNLGADSQILARGDNSAGDSAGGSVTLQSGNNFSDSAGSQISVAGGSQGGNGGSVEISAKNLGDIHSQLNGSAQAGFIGGKILIDPTDLTLNSSSLNPYSGFANILFSATGNITLAQNAILNLSSSTGVGSGQLTLQAGGDIVFENNSQITDPNDWSVTLEAGYNFVNNSVQSGVGNIYLNGGSGQTLNAIQTASGNINLTAGQNILVGSGYVITTGGGSINAHALAGNIDTGSDAQGYFFETDADSLSGAYDLNDGLGGISTAAGGDVNLTAGGNVTSVLPYANSGEIAYIYDGGVPSTSVASSVNQDFATAGSGAYGNQPGNVNIVAGGNVIGNYLVANGTGSIFAGVTMDANGNPVEDSSGNYVLSTIVNTGSAGTDANKNALALSLISGGWNVTAAQNIILQEVSNPNGDFDVNAGAAYNNYFDYSPGDYVNLSAGNSVQLGASSLPRASVNEPIIYPPILNINAGAGGVILGTQSSANGLILFPSPEGSLTINTTQGGSLVGNLPPIGPSKAPQIFDLTVSDSGSSQYTSSASFGLNEIHAASPVHLNNSTPIVLNISGDMDLVFLDASEAAQINVVGNMNNSRFQGMNLLPTDVTSITVGQVAKENMENSGLLNPVTDSNLKVGGDINNAGTYTTVDLSQVSGAQVDLSYLSIGLPGPGQPLATTLATSFFYNPATGILTYKNIIGVSLPSVLIPLLENLTVQKYVNGVPQWEDPPYDTIPTPDPNPVPALNAAAAQALLTQYNIAGTVPNQANANGYTIGGGGTFDISARNMDLGTTAGIQSKGVSLYNIGSSYPLASLFDQGADINVNASGDLTMYSSSIASLNGGSINVNAAGIINVGSADFSVNTLGTHGIYSTSGGDISVVAAGDINVNGSRIVTYDGGNVTVESLNGSVDAGNGVSFPVTVSGYYVGYYVDPITLKVSHPVYGFDPQIPFSGILALTFPARDASYPAPNATLGNILIEAPNGNVSANTSGILQVALNGLNYPDATTTVLAGYELLDASGNHLLSATDIAADDAFRALTGGNSPYAADFVDGNGNIVGELVLGSEDKDINVGGSGLIASNAKLDASGNINGLIFARNNIDITAQQNVNVTALGVGNVTVNSGGTISGTIIGVGGVSVSGGSIDASLISANVSGATSGQSGLGQGTAANSTSQSMQSDDSTKVAASSDDENADDLKKKGKQIALAQKVGRVTVILPPKGKL